MGGGGGRRTKSACGFCSGGQFEKGGGGGGIMYTAIGTLLEFYTFPANTSLFNCLGIAMTECESTYMARTFIQTRKCPVDLLSFLCKLGKHHIQHHCMSHDLLPAKPHARIHKDGKPQPIKESLSFVQHIR